MQYHKAHFLCFQSVLARTAGAAVEQVAGEEETTALQWVSASDSGTFAWVYASRFSFPPAFPTPQESGELPSWALAIVLSASFISLLWFAALVLLVRWLRPQLALPILVWSPCRSYMKFAVVGATRGYQLPHLPLLPSACLRPDSLPS